MSIISLQASYTYIFTDYDLVLRGDYYVVLLVVLPTAVETALRFWQRQIQYHTQAPITSIIIVIIICL